MKKLAVFVLALAFFTACEKENDDNPTTPEVCDVKGTYAGSSTTTVGTTALAYKLEDNNFAIGYVTLAGGAVTFGGYKNTCDSVYISVHYSGNNSYYLLKGKFSNNRTTLAGTVNNLTTPSDFGTFTLTKQ
jgi:hypothetical protein